MITLTMKERLEILRDFYLHATRENQKVMCPFGKNPPPAVMERKNPRANQSCEDLCGMFPMLGDVRKGCPCQIFGADLALYILGVMLKKQNLI